MSIRTRSPSLRTQGIIEYLTCTHPEGSAYKRLARAVTREDRDGTGSNGTSGSNSQGIRDYHSDDLRDYDPTHYLIREVWAAKNGDTVDYWISEADTDLDGFGPSPEINHEVSRAEAIETTGNWLLEGRAAFDIEEWGGIEWASSQDGEMGSNWFPSDRLVLDWLDEEMELDRIEEQLEREHQRLNAPENGINHLERGAKDAEGGEDNDAT